MKLFDYALMPLALGALTLSVLQSCSSDSTTDPSVSSQEQRFSNTQLPESKFYTCKVLDESGALKNCLYYSDFPMFLYDSVFEKCPGNFEISECPDGATHVCDKVSEEWLDKQLYLYSVNPAVEECPASH